MESYELRFREPVVVFSLAYSMRFFRGEGFTEFKQIEVEEAMGKVLKDVGKRYLDPALRFHSSPFQEPYPPMFFHSPDFAFTGSVHFISDEKDGLLFTRLGFLDIRLGFLVDSSNREAVVALDRHVSDNYHRV